MPKPPHSSVIAIFHHPEELATSQGMIDDLVADADDSVVMPVEVTTGTQEEFTNVHFLEYLYNGDLIRMPAAYLLEKAGQVVVTGRALDTAMGQFVAMQTLDRLTIAELGAAAQKEAA